MCHKNFKKLIKNIKFVFNLKKNHTHLVSEMEEFKKLKAYIADRQKLYVNEFIQVGDYTYGEPTVYSWGEGTHLKIGKFCSIASNVKIYLGGNHNTSFCTTYPFNALLKNFSDIKGHPLSNGDVNIGNDVWLASDSTIMSGVNIGNGAVVANKALVTKDVPPYSIVAGIPAKVIKTRFNQDKINKLLEMQWWEWPEEKIINAIIILQSNNIDQLYEYWKNFVV